MKHLDITIDIETLSLLPNASILQIVAVPWNRRGENSPFIDTIVPFNQHVDLRSCVKDGFAIGEKEVQWWNQQSEGLKNIVFSPTAFPLKDVLANLNDWIEDTKSTLGAESICLWAQGSDFDIAILRNAFCRYGMTFPLHRSSFRDARTYILEIGAVLLLENTVDSVVSPHKVYAALPKAEGIEGFAHDPLFDAKRTTWSVWSLMKMCD